MGPRRRCSRPGAPSANDLAIRETGVAQVTGDLLDSESVQRAVAGCETVYHCAATYAFWSPRPREVYRSNVAGTENLLDAARRAGVRRVVFTSSVSTIGIPDHGPTTRSAWALKRCRPDRLC